MQNDNQHTENTDEINLLELFTQLFRQRWLILAITAVCIVLVMGFQAIKWRTYKPKAVGYPIALTFIGAKDYRYPNGTPFSSEDIINPAYIASALQKLSLPNDLQQVAAALSIANANTLFQSVEAKLLEGLSVDKGKKRPQDIVQDTRTALESLKSLAQTYLTLKVNLPRSGLSLPDAKMLLETLVAEWADDINTKGLLNPNIIFPRAAFIINEKASILENYDDLNRYAKQLSNAIKQLSEINGGETLILNGRGLYDLSRILENTITSQIQVMHAYSYAVSPLLTKVDPMVDILVFSQKRMKQLDKEELEKNIATYDTVLANLDNKGFQRGQGGAQFNLSSTTTGEQARLDNGLLGELLDLGSQVSASDLKKSIIEKRMQAAEALFQLEKEIAIISGEGLTPSDNLSGQQAMLDKLPNELKKAADKVNQLQAEFILMVKEFSRIQLNKRSNLYSPLDRPHALGNSGFSLKNTLVLLMIATLLGLLLGCVIAMLRYGIQQKRQNHPLESTR